MEKNIDNIEFRKLVLSFRDNGFTIDETRILLEVPEVVVIDILRTFSIIDVDTKLNHGRYSEEELKQINSTKKVKTLVKELNRSYFTIKDKRRQDRKTKRKQEERECCVGGKNKAFTNSERFFIKLSYENGTSISYIANALNRTDSSIRAFCSKNDIKRKTKVERNIN